MEIAIETLDVRYERRRRSDPRREKRLLASLAEVGRQFPILVVDGEGGAVITYSTLTDFCRRHALVKPPDPPAGYYDSAPGEEMQHDTSPHDTVIGGKSRRIRTASLVFRHSRMIFAQMYPRFTRFECKQFLTDAVKYSGGSCGRCMIDNTHVVVAVGTGREMKASPEMFAFAERFGFGFAAHEKGDAK